MKFLKCFKLVVCLIIINQYISAQCTNFNVWNDSWTSCKLSASPNSVRGDSHWLLYEFEEPQGIGDLYIWNANRAGESQLGVKEVIIDFSEDGVNWIELGDFDFPKADESEDYEGFEGPSFEGVLIKKILFTCVSNYDETSNDCVSIAEVQFEKEQKDISEDEVEIIEEELSSLTVYPNPFTSEVIIGDAANSSVRLYDLNGKLILETTIVNDNETIDLSNLSNSLYYAIFTTAEGKIFVVKILKE